MNAPLRQSSFVDEVVDTPFRIDAERYGQLGESGLLDDWGRVELRGGVIVKMNSEYMPHMMAKTELGVALTLAVRSAQLPLRVGVDGSLRLSRFDVPDPDVVVFEGAFHRGFVDAGAARLVVEVSDSSIAKDMGIKEPLYARHGIREFWLADVNARILYVMSGPTPDGYADRKVFRCGERVVSVTIPGLEIEVPDF